MHELLRTSDVVLVSFVEALLREQRIDYHVADRNTSAVEASIGIFPRRILIASSDLQAARELLVDAGLASELPQVDGEPETDRMGRPGGRTV
jgi:hypothetical protein